MTSDSRYFVVRGRLCCKANPDLDEAERADLVGRLMVARPLVRDAKKCATAMRKQPRTGPAEQVKRRSASAVRCGGKTAHRISIGTWKNH